ncbi:SDR family NAD(P)-dependent oxidoreductase [Gilvimarinus xylanilyticus]|uniref:SDR family oxidoreductase n=1 Tax=Gilvimarinus xylanilyticus TaxID=2944139 RepID=A0A9X2HUB8_9GAMM|nr:SDR family oxidoreductase [Gilvimarinus xylanilyticus]MCP8897784.1 SDR family oxidoreductase [Gilvimarinus xylanilyticus]
MDSRNRSPSPRVALVTGSTSGIGKAIAERFARDGMTVVFHSKLSVQAGESLASQYPGASYHQADLANGAQIKRLVESVIAEHGRLDVLVNNAGINAVVPHTDLQGAGAELWRELYEVNVIAPWLLIGAAESALRACATADCPSCIVNITSHAGVRPKGASIPYAASKAALNHTTQLLARSLAPAIRVNAIAPGLVDTPMTETWEEAQTLWREKAPMGRGARPEEIAQLASMLVENHYLTGEIIVSDGGLHLT